jgi:hypothetical protein
MSDLRFLGQSRALGASNHTQSSSKVLTVGVLGPVLRIGGGEVGGRRLMRGRLGKGAKLRIRKRRSPCGKTKTFLSGYAS